MTVKLKTMPLTANNEKGYVTIISSANDEIELDLKMQPKLNYADPRVEADIGKATVSYGPFIMCAEGIDNPYLNESVIKDGEMQAVLGKLGLPAVIVPAAPQPLYMIPYHAFANRGETDMKIWVKKIQN